MGMEKGGVQLSQIEPVRGEISDACSDNLEGKSAGVDLSRRRLFLPLKPARAGNSGDALISKSVPDHATEVSEAAEEQMVKVAVLKDMMAALIRGTSAQSLLTSDDMFLDLFMQDVLLVPGDNGGVALLENLADMDTDEKKKFIGRSVRGLLSDEVFEDIVEMVGQKSRYYYSTKSMSANYAKMLMLVEEKDRCTMIAEVVRFECVTYPRPYAVEMLQHAPFFISKDEVHVAVTALGKTKGCEDILSVQASNDALYLYSNKHMTQGMARGLCEWIEVEQFANP